MTMGHASEPGNVLSDRRPSASAGRESGGEPAKPVPPPAKVAPARTPPTSGLSTLAFTVVLIAALYLGREVFLPLVLAVLLSFVLAPLVTLLRRIRFGRVLSVVVAVLVALGIIAGVTTIIGSQVAELSTNLPRYQASVEHKVETLQEGILGRANHLLQRFNRQVEATRAQVSNTEQEAGPAGGAPEKPLLVRVQDPQLSPIDIARKVVGPVLQPLTTVGIVLVVVIFLLLQREDLRDRLIRLAGAKDLHRTTVAMSDAAERLSTYFLAQLGVNIAFGVLIGTGLWLIGVPSPILWGLFSTLMRFIPYIGAFISGLLPLALAAAVDPGWSMAAMTAALFLIAEPVTGQVVEPLLYGHSTGLSPFAVIVSTLFWGFLWGPVGLVLATPFTVCLVVLGRHVERFEFLDVLLGDRPPLTPVENFYQRMLAGDPDEAQEQAELLLHERSLSSYYDEVALKALQLAANDYQRGALDEPQLEKIKALTNALVSEFRDRPDEIPPPDHPAQQAQSLAERQHEKHEFIPGTAPPQQERSGPWQSATPVLCIAGRGPLDEAAATMLAQLLTKHGLGARVAPYTSVSREQIANLDLEGIAMVCVSYLDIQGNPAHLRYLLRRLKMRAPSAPVLVGLWPEEDTILSDEKLRREVGADFYVVSLRQAVEACLQAAGAPAEAAAVRA